MRAASQTASRRQGGACSRSTRRPCGWRQRSGAPTTRQGRCTARARVRPWTGIVGRWRRREGRSRRCNLSPKVRVPGLEGGQHASYRRVEHRLIAAELHGEPIAGVHARGAAKRGLQRRVLCHQSGGATPRRDRVEALDEGHADHRTGRVAGAPGPPRGLKLRASLVISGESSSPASSEAPERSGTFDAATELVPSRS